MVSCWSADRALDRFLVVFSREHSCVSLEDCRLLPKSLIFRWSLQKFTLKSRECRSSSIMHELGSGSYISALMIGPQHILE
jgi:hypothetical protein